MHTSPKNRAIVWGCIAAAVVGNAAGYLLNLYESIRWFDEAIHTYTAFAITLPLALVVYGEVLSGARYRPVLFMLAAASLGIAIGVLWEISEWLYDAAVAGNVIRGKTDTMIDLIVDSVGALLAGWVAGRMVRPPERGLRGAPGA